MNIKANRFKKMKKNDKEVIIRYPGIEYD